MVGSAQHWVGMSLVRCGLQVMFVDPALSE
jgi:hypothetical protein